MPAHTGPLRMEEGRGLHTSTPHFSGPRQPCSLGRGHSDSPDCYFCTHTCWEELRIMAESGAQKILWEITIIYTIPRPRLLRVYEKLRNLNGIIWISKTITPRAPGILQIDKLLHKNTKYMNHACLRDNVRQRGWQLSRLCHFLNIWSGVYPGFKMEGPSFTVRLCWGHTVSQHKALGDVPADDKNSMTVTPLPRLESLRGWA